MIVAGWVRVVLGGLLVGFVGGHRVVRFVGGHRVVGFVGRGWVDGGLVGCGALVKCGWGIAIVSRWTGSIQALKGGM